MSTLAVESSKMRIRGSRSSVRAMAMRCFWPPESVTPRSPTQVVIAVRQADDELVDAGGLGRGARSLPASRPARPYAMLSRMVPMNRKTSCCTMPMLRRSDSSVMSRTSMAIDRDAAAGHVVEAGHQVHDRGLAASRPARGARSPCRAGIDIDADERRG